MVETLMAINVVLVHALVLPVTAFPIVYAVTANWRATAAGRSVMIASVALALFLDISVVLSYLRAPAPILTASINTVVILSIMAGSIYQLAALIRNRWRALMARRAARHAQPNQPEE